MKDTQRTTVRLAGALALALTLLVPLAQASAATTTTAKKPLVMHKVPLSKVPLHTQFIVEVNKMGQVVRVKSGTDCKDLTFNAQTYGNVLQTWIRHPDGTAEVGLYRVDYNYAPVGAKITRHVALIKPGGNWGNQRGAANDMVDTANAQYAAWQKQQNAKHKLPSLKTILKPTPKPLRRR